VEEESLPGVSAAGRGYIDVTQSGCGSLNDGVGVTALVEAEHVRYQDWYWCSPISKNTLRENNPWNGVGDSSQPFLMVQISGKMSASICVVVSGSGCDCYSESLLVHIA
jgi:hypothetical protein